MNSSNLTIAVLGANGRSGEFFVREALKHGYKVKAGIFSGDLPPSENLEVLRCNVMDQDDINKICDGVDVVVSLIGHGRKSPADLQQMAMKNIIIALADKPNTRLITLTGTGVRCVGDKPSLIDRFLNFGIKKVDPQRISDGVKHVDILKASNISWTVIRVLKLTNGDNMGEVTMNLTGPAELFTPRARVARAIIQIIDNNLYQKECPIITGVKKES